MPIWHIIPAEKYPFVNCILLKICHCNSPFLFFFSGTFSPFLQFILIFKHPQELIQTENELENENKAWFTWSISVFATTGLSKTSISITVVSPKGGFYKIKRSIKELVGQSWVPTHLLFCKWILYHLDNYPFKNWLTAYSKSSLFRARSSVTFRQL